MILGGVAANDVEIAFVLVQVDQHLPRLATAVDFQHQLLFQTARPFARHVGARLKHGIADG